MVRASESSWVAEIGCQAQETLAIRSQAQDLRRGHAIQQLLASQIIPHGAMAKRVTHRGERESDIDFDCQTT